MFESRARQFFFYNSKIQGYTITGLTVTEWRNANLRLFSVGQHDQTRIQTILLFN